MFFSWFSLTRRSIFFGGGAQRGAAQCKTKTNFIFPEKTPYAIIMLMRRTANQRGARRFSAQAPQPRLTSRRVVPARRRLFRNRWNTMSFQSRNSAVSSFLGKATSNFRNLGNLSEHINVTSHYFKFHTIQQCNHKNALTRNENKYCPVKKNNP